jgi:hypothetical protein
MAGKKRAGLPYSAPESGFGKRAVYNWGWDPRAILRWGQMQALAVIEMLKAIEQRYGAEGQQVCIDAIHEVGRRIGQAAEEDIKREMPEGLSDREKLMFRLSYWNRNIYANPDVWTFISDDEFYFDVLWCPHQDIYSARDCRVQRYFVEGLVLGALQVSGLEGTRVAQFEVTIPKIIPHGDEVCRFHFRRAKKGEQVETWDQYSRRLAERELREASSGKRQRIAQKRQKG